MDEILPQHAWLTERYANWYDRNPIPMPDRFARREFGFLYHGQKFFQRHMGFRTADEVHRFMADRGPAHAYYSTAFYKQPNAPTMQEKGWLGAELIFDLDADHVPGAEKLGYREQLARVKEFFLKLVDRFVVAELGFQERDLLLTFSGGRGYHCHVLQEKALALSSVERREIVDYVTGTGLQLEKFIRPKRLHRQVGGFSKEVESLVIDGADSAGWGARINEAVVQLIEDWKTSDEARLKEDLGSVYKFTKATWITFQRDLARADPKRIEAGFLDFGPVMLKILPRKLKLDAILPLAKGETDEPVTSDVKRLIRLPGSLHGKSGLRVVTLERSDVEGFDPLVDAVAFTDEPTRVKVTKPAKVDVAGFTAELPVGEATMPESAAVMLMARGAAVPV